jgi:hypothetical protein
LGLTSWVDLVQERINQPEESGDAAGRCHALHRDGEGRRYAAGRKKKEIGVRYKQVPIEILSPAEYFFVDDFLPSSN